MCSCFGKETQHQKAESMLALSRKMCPSDFSSEWEALSHAHFTCTHSQTEKSDPLGHHTPPSVERTEAVFHRIRFEECSIRNKALASVIMLNNQLFD